MKDKLFWTLYGYFEAIDHMSTFYVLIYFLIVIINVINYLQCNVTEFRKIGLLTRQLDTNHGKVFMTKCQRIQIASYNNYRKLSFVSEPVGLNRVRMGVVPFLVLALFLLVLSAETKKNGGKLKEFKTCVSGFCLPKNYRFLML